ncbi:hypothetical protein RV420_400418 [Roseovarius sp. EC-SD190]|nr:hypothetical protein RV420_400418 [Roseovarius sp. EC-SD190]
MIRRLSTIGAKERGQRSAEGSFGPGPITDQCGRPAGRAPLTSSGWYEGSREKQISGSSGSNGPSALMLRREPMCRWSTSKCQRAMLHHRIDALSPKRVVGMSLTILTGQSFVSGGPRRWARFILTIKKATNKKCSVSYEYPLSSKSQRHC